MKKIHLIVGARPNIIKASPVYNSLKNLKKYIIKVINTGQHYDNIMMNTNVLESCRLTKVKNLVSFLSTCIFPDKIEYPLTEKKIHEGAPHASNYGYAYAKRMLDVQTEVYREQYGVNFVSIIPTNIYGPHDNFNIDGGHVIPSLIHKCYMAKKLKGMKPLKL